MKTENIPNIENITRLEVIDHSKHSLEKGRKLTKYLAEGEVLRFSFQDNNKTLKIFITNPIT